MGTASLDQDLETLTPGDENVLALNGVAKVLESPGERYNPLFVFGPPSTGKTHLLGAMCRRMREEHPDWNIKYYTAGQFLDECDTVWQAKTAYEFRHKLWNLDALLIDDVQSFANRPAALEELYHAFNRLIADGRQLVLASRLAPAELAEFPITLRSRFQSGLVVCLDTPREPLLRSIVEQKTQRAGVNLTQKAASFLCREVRSIRELNGVLNHLETKAKEGGKRVAIEDIREIIHRRVAERVSVSDVAKAVCHFFRVELTRVRSASRQQSLVQARQLGMFLARELTDAPLATIGDYFGGRDHTTALYACRKVAKSLRSDPTLSRAATEIRSQLRG